jgi:hypothetical protein
MIQIKKVRRQEQAKIQQRHFTTHYYHTKQLTMYGQQGGYGQAPPQQQYNAGYQQQQQQYVPQQQTQQQYGGPAQQQMMQEQPQQAQQTQQQPQQPAVDQSKQQPIHVDTQHDDMVHDAQLDYYGTKLATSSSGKYYFLRTKFPCWHNVFN